MPCKIQIKQNLTDKISADTDSGYNKSIKSAKAIAKKVNQSYGVPVVSFSLNGDFIDRNITIPNSLVDVYYNHELSLEQQELTISPSQTEQIKLQDMSSLGKLEGEKVSTEKGAIGIKKSDGTEITEEDIKQNPTFYQNNTDQSTEKYIASEKTIRDLAARMSDRIGIPVRFKSDRTKEYKGKLERNTAVVNLAYATLDTPIHEILGHPIIRAIKNRNVDKQAQDWVSNGDTIIDEKGDKFKVKEVTEDYTFILEDGSEVDATEYAKFTPKTELYQNLLKELETGKGKEVLDRIKRDYQYKNKAERGDTFILNGNKYNSNTRTGSRFFEKNGGIISTKEYNIALQEYNSIKYSLEEQQEEAIVELLGLMTAEKLDNVKDGKLISLLKRLLKEIKQFVRSLLNQKEVEIDKLPDNMTLGDISDLLAYSNSKLILPGYEVQYTTPDNQTFKTYQEASNHISDLAKSVQDVDLEGIKIEKKTVVGKIDPITGKKIKSAKFNKGSDSYFSPDENQYEPGEPDTFDLVFEDGTKNTVYDEDLYINQSDEIQMFYSQIRPFDNTIEKFIEKNKEYEQSKEIIEEWKKVNNIQYNPEEIYSRGQEFSSVVGAYSSFDVNLMMQNLLQHIEDNKKAGGKFAISAYTKPVDKQIGHLEGGGGKIKFNIYPKSQDILWAANSDVYSGSVWDASKKVNKDKKSELLGVSYTKYPSLQSINSVQPNLADIVDNLSHHHNELGITLTGNNFRLEYDDNIPYQTKKIIDGINKILDQKYGKVVKPNIDKIQRQSKIRNWRISKAGLQEGVQMWALEYTSGNNIEDIDGDIDFFTSEQEARDYLDKLIQDSKKQIGIQPTQTNENLKEDINSIKSKVVKYNEGSLTDKSEFTEVSEKEYNEAVKKGKKGFVLGTTSFGYSETYDYNGYIYTQIDYNKETSVDTYGKIKKESKEYTSQALINIKIAALKEVAKKYPRSLIRSEVRPYKSTNQVQSLFDPDELPFQLVGDESLTPKQQLEENIKKQQAQSKFQEYVNATGKQNIEGFKKSIPVSSQSKVEVTSSSVKPEVQELFESNPELANTVYESLGYKTKADVILPIGTSGSGKSTFIKSLPQENLVVIEPDAMRVGFTGNMNDKSKDKEIYEEAAKRAVTAIKQGKQVVFDTTNLTKNKRLPFIEAIKKAVPSANIQYKLMELNPELAKQRIKADITAGKNRANVPDSSIDRQAQSYNQMLEDIKNESISSFDLTPQQKQQAISKFQEYVNTTGKQDIKGFKEFVTQPSIEIIANVDTNATAIEDINEVLNSSSVIIIQTNDSIIVKTNSNSAEVNISDTQRLLADLSQNSENIKFDENENSLIEDDDISLPETTEEQQQQEEQLFSDLMQSENISKAESLVEWWNSNVQGNPRALKNMRQAKIKSLDDAIILYGDMFSQTKQGEQELIEILQCFL